MNIKNKVVVYKTIDNKVAVVIPAPEMFDSESKTRHLLKSKGIDFKSDEEITEFILNPHRQNLNYINDSETIIDKSDLPDRTFRDAWCFNNSKIEHDFNKCQEILRERRNQKLEELDKQAFSESRKPKGNIEEINKKAQILRDIPQDMKFNSKDINDLIELNNRIKE